jgi:hypothetical protein
MSIARRAALLPLAVVLLLALLASLTQRASTDACDWLMDCAEALLRWIESEQC